MSASPNSTVGVPIGFRLPEAVSRLVGQDARMQIGYLASHYPAVSHTFLWREVEALRRRGLDVRTLSVRRTPADQLLSEADREAARTTFAIVPSPVLRALAAHVLAFVSAPGRYLGVLGWALSTSAPGVRARLWRLFYFAEAIILWAHCRRTGTRHLHAQFADTATDVAMLAARFGGAAWSWSMAVHGPVEFYNVELYRLRDKLESASFVQAISDFGRSQLMTLVDEEHWHKLHVVHMGIEPAVYSPPGERRTADGELAILCVGRLVHLKGQSLIVEAVARLNQRGVPARAVLVGAGPKLAFLESQARRLGVADRVELTGPLGQAEVRERYLEADVFCLPSFAEGVPVVLMEAMALELPVVTTRIMGIPELVEDGVSGLLLRPGRADDLFEALRELSRDATRGRRMGREGRKKVLAEYDVDGCAATLARLFEDRRGGQQAGYSRPA